MAYYRQVTAHELEALSHLVTRTWATHNAFNHDTDRQSRECEKCRVTARAQRALKAIQKRHERKE